MKALGVFCVIFCVSASTYVNADPIQYELTNYCGQTVYVYSSAILTINGQTYGGSCYVDIRGNHAYYNNEVRLKIMALYADCYTNWVTFYDSITSMSGRVCGAWQDTWLTSTNTLRIAINSTERYQWSSQVTARMLVTSTSTVYQSGDFTCSNGYDIAGSLKCDGYDNCGDDSDENNDACGPNDVIVSWTAEIGIIAGVGIVCFVVILLLIVVVVRNRRRQGAVDYVTNRQGMLKPEYNYGPPPYGAINNGYMPTQPPPYNGTVSMPPPPLPPQSSGTETSAS